MLCPLQGDFKHDLGLRIGSLGARGKPPRSASSAALPGVALADRVFLLNLQRREGRSAIGERLGKWSPAPAPDCGMICKERVRDAVAGLPIFDPTAKNRESDSIYALVCKLSAGTPQERSLKALGGHPPRLQTRVKTGVGTAQRRAPYTTFRPHQARSRNFS